MRQLKLPQTSPESAPYSPAILKWAGGKRWLAPILGPTIRKLLEETTGRYIEPFVGGGSVALWLGAQQMVLADIEVPLIELYRAVKEEADGVSSELERLISKGTDRDSYLRVRSLMPDRSVERAARLIYLNRLCFNGLYRTNRAGRFNVPYGAQKTLSFPNRTQLNAAKLALTGATVLACDFGLTLATATTGDVIFADPPYHAVGKGFVSYYRHPFAETEQERLAQALLAARERGAVVFTTNADTPLVRSLYQWGIIEETRERRAINSDPSRRGPVRCVLIRAGVDRY